MGTLRMLLLQRARRARRPHPCIPEKCRWRSKTVRETWIEGVLQSDVCVVRELNYNARLWRMGMSAQWIAVVFLLCGTAFSQQAGANWLSPSDEQIARAIDLGFQAAKPPYHAFSFDPQKSKIGTKYLQQPNL